MRHEKKSRNDAPKEPKLCLFCAKKDIVIDYKDDELLRKFVDDHGKLYPRKKTGCCAGHQRKIANSVKNARHIAILPFVAENVF